MTFRTLRTEQHEQGIATSSGAIGHRYEFGVRNWPQPTNGTIGRYELGALFARFLRVLSIEPWGSIRPAEFPAESISTRTLQGVPCLEAYRYSVG